MPYEHLTLGPDAVLWACDHRSVHRWEHGAWTEEPPETFDSGLLQGLTVDLDGRPWVLTAHALWRLDGDRWNRIDGRAVGQTEPYFSAIVTAADGTVYVTTMGGTFAYRDGHWTATALSERFGGLDTLVAGPAGHVAASGGVGTLVVAAPDGPVRRTNLADGPADARRGDVRAIDAAGRVWLTTDNGVVIVDARGDLVQQWAPGTVAGLDGKVTALAVVDDGPAMPPLRAAATGTITGRVLRAGKPVARATVELCDMPLMVFERTPCASATAAFSGTTAADGTFQIPGVPVGSFGFAVKPDATWRVLLDGNCCSGLEPGGSYDIGAITVR
jgi:ligand-binding sensor domain-containing protein